MSENVERHGQVIGFHAGHARVRLADAPGCAACGSRGTCASGQKESTLIDVVLPAGACAGDRVTLTVSSASLTLAALLGYLLPPVTLLVGAVAASLVFAGDAAAVFGAGAGLLAGLLIVRLASAPLLGRNFSAATCRPHFEPGERP